MGVFSSPLSTLYTSMSCSVQKSIQRSCPWLPLSPQDLTLPRVEWTHQPWFPTFPHQQSFSARWGVWEVLRPIEVGLRQKKKKKWTMGLSWGWHEVPGQSCLPHCTRAGRSLESCPLLRSDRNLPNHLGLGHSTVRWSVWNLQVPGTLSRPSMRCLVFTTAVKGKCYSLHLSVKKLKPTQLRLTKPHMSLEICLCLCVISTLSQGF